MKIRSERATTGRLDALCIVYEEKFHIDLYACGHFCGLSMMRPQCCACDHATQEAMCDICAVGDRSSKAEHPPFKRDDADSNSAEPTNA